MLRGNLTEVTFKNGLVVDLNPDSILVIIGPNNSGKSATLADRMSLLENDNGHTFSLSDLSFHRDSTIEDFKLAYSYTLTDGGVFDFKDFQFHDWDFNSKWKGDQRTIGKSFSRLLISNLGTRQRLADCDPPSTFDTKKPHYADHPFQRMYLDDGLEAEVSSIFRDAFKADLVVHRAGSKYISLYVGDKPEMKADEDRVSRTYLDRLESLAPLEKQGDGVRSFVSIIARVLTEQRSIQLIDEPEAFLHPPPKLGGERSGAASEAAIVRQWLPPIVKRFCKVLLPAVVGA